MKTIGLIGGMSWKSSLEYYKMINEFVHEKLGGWHSAKIILYSVDFDEIDLEHHTGQGEISDEIIFTAAKKLEGAGADVLILGANTMHVLADKIASKISIPLIHIADATAEQIKLEGIKKVGLLGTKYTMQQDFYKGKLKDHGLDVIVPNSEDIEIINREINNYILGNVSENAKKHLIEIIAKLEEQGVEGIILGCTELPLMIEQLDVKVKLFDTTTIHARAAVDFAFR